MHQTTGKVVLKGIESIPIYCVASRHDLECTYKWDCVDTILSGNTPVLWIHTPGTYRCVVSSQWYTCSSKTIVVERVKEGSASCTCLIYTFTHYILIINSVA